MKAQIHPATRAQAPLQASVARRGFSSTSPLPWALALLVLLALVLWRGEAADTAANTVREAAPPAQWVRLLRFEDRPNGDVAAIDTTTGLEISRYQGEQGFLRGTLRSFARERTLRGIGPQQPLELVGHVDGRLSLIDPATGQRIALESFGPSNLAVFAALRPSASSALSRSQP